MSRARDIVRLASVRLGSPAELEAMADVLRAMVGRATSLVVLPLVSARTLTALTAPGVRVPGSGTQVEVADALLQQWRLVVDGSAENAVAQLWDLDRNLALATVAMPTTSSVVAGAWQVTPVAAPVAHRLEVRVIGSGSVGIDSLTAQARTITAPAR